MANITLGNLRDIWQGILNWVNGTDAVSSPKVQVMGSNVMNGNLLTLVATNLATQLPSIPCREITLIGLKNNAGTVYVGGANVANVLNPTTAPTLSTSGTGSTLPIGTYFSKYTWVNANGETLASPEASIAYGVANPTAAPTLATSTTGGSLAAATYYVKYTWVNANGETQASPEASITTTGTTSTITTTIPALPAGATSANVYISTATGTETNQGSTTTTTYTQTAALVAGTSQPASNTTTGGKNIVVTMPTLPAGVTSANVYISTATGTETKQGNTTTTSYTQSSALTTGTVLPVKNTATVYGAAFDAKDSQTFPVNNANMIYIYGTAGDGVSYVAV